MRILPCCNASTPKAATDQPMSTCPLIVCVNVEAGLPVAMGRSGTPVLREREHRDVGGEPAVEYAIDFRSVLSDLIGELAGTYQNSRRRRSLSSRSRATGRL